MRLGKPSHNHLNTKTTVLVFTGMMVFHTESCQVDCMAECMMEGQTENQQRDNLQLLYLLLHVFIHFLVWCNKGMLDATKWIHCSPSKQPGAITVKGRVDPSTGHEGTEWKQSYRSTLSSTSVLYWGGWSTPCPGHFTSWKETQYPPYRRLGGPWGQSGQLQKISPPPGFDSWTIQPIASCHTNYITSACAFTALGTKNECADCGHCGPAAAFRTSHYHPVAAA